MFTKQQEQLLDSFADLSDQLLDLRVISTDSFTGEIGEYVACKVFDLKKSKRVTQAVDGISKTGEKYQIKAKITSGSFNYHLKALETKLFDYLVIVYFDRQYNPIKIIKIPARSINNNEISISGSNINSFEHVESENIRIPAATKEVINNFASVYQKLVETEIIRSRRIVGDIGEFYACKRLNLNISDNWNQKGFDARHENGLTFEIKTRRVYQSDRRICETRRLNNLVGKTADYLIVVTIDRSFKCSGMWLIPMKNLENPKSANLKVVNNTPGTLNLIPSRISWLKTGTKFTSFDKIPVNKRSYANSKRKASVKSKPEEYDYDELEIINKEIRAKTRADRRMKIQTEAIENKSIWSRITASIEKHDDFGGCATYGLIILFLIYLLALLFQ